MLVPTQKDCGKNGHSNQTHCKRGHVFDELNTYISPKSQKRSCLTCEAHRKQILFERDPAGARKAGREHMRKWRNANREAYNKRAVELRHKKKQWLDSHKTACIKCREVDTNCLDFHHVNASTKDANLASAIAHWSIKKLEAEMKKCIVLCANCHRKLHATERLEKEN